MADSTWPSAQAQTLGSPKTHANRESGGEVGTDPRLIRKQDGHSFLATNRKLIMQEDLNAAGRLFGGRLMEWIDEAAALYCMTQIGTRSIVTKKISEVIFNEPAHLGDVLEFVFRIKQTGTTSVVIESRAVAMAISKDERERLIVQCDLVFVALDRNGKPTPHHLQVDPGQSPA
jgi:acyl-CoA thioesterase YciA